jgi:hypothetical protein
LRLQPARLLARAADAADNPLKTSDPSGRTRRIRKMRGQVQEGAIYLPVLYAQPFSPIVWTVLRTAKDLKDEGVDPP